MRKEGPLLSRHVMWAGKVRGALFVLEERDVELHRSIRVAKIIRTAPHAQLLPALFDAVLIGAQPDWWTITGWERIEDGISDRARAYAQSWILIPTDCRDR